MRRKLFGKLKQNKAFTLMEMMIVSAIIIVLLSISIIGINDWSRKMKMTELDNYAKSVYLEAQNQLASLAAEGSLAKLHNDLSITSGTYYEDYHNRNLTVAPADYNVSEFGDFYQGLYYFAKSDSIITLFVPANSLTAENGSYLLELNPETGDVYGVFYWENGNSYLTSENAVDNYTKLKNMDVKGTGNNRSLASRTEYLVGYYGGNGGETISSSSYALNQQVEIVNGEELYIKLSYDYNERVIEYIAGDARPFDIEITIIGETSGEKWIPEFDLTADNYIVENGRIITGFLLDGMGANQDFGAIVAAAGKHFLPGENLKISVKTLYQQEGVKLKEQSATYHTNSLFHDVVDRLEGAGAEQNLVRAIGISTVRHLRNLNSTYYNGDIVSLVNGKEIDTYEIIQKNDIDFTTGEYWFTDSRPVSSIAPIVNDAIFTIGSKSVSVNGNDFVIRNLVVNANVSNAGLFAKTVNVDFIKVKLEDYTLYAPNATNVGGLVGYAIGGKIDHSGVYLSPFYRDASGVKQYYNQENDTTYGNKMMAHYATMTVTGKENVGGLAGKVERTNITDSYGAVQVKGETTVGGLIGCAKGTVPEGYNMQSVDTDAEVNTLVSIKNSYASGTVYASTKEAGGLIGYAEDLCVDNAYATGDVYSDTEMAGFVGDTRHSYYRNSYSYGEVLTKDGKDNFVAGSTVVGGFFATGADNHADLASIGYLTQIGYNSADAFFTDATIGIKREYRDLTALVTKSSAASSYPYDGNLLFKAFPFLMVTDNHYGDWPSQYFINTSLVYYEKYADGSYGYYSVTKLTDNTDINSNVSKYVWVLDSLRDDIECREDGYALLSMFYLDSVDYSVYQYADKTADNTKNPMWQLAQGQDGTIIKGTLSVVQNAADAASDKMVNLTQQGALVFNAYEEVENPYNASYKDKEIKSAFVTNGMYLYQLPYELQNTYRYDVDNFYDVIVFDEGYAVGNTKGDAGEIAPTPVISNEVYYYCPHFPRLAINPGLGVSESTTNFVQLEAPYTVAVRTARQLNNLGRVPYYWNDKGGGTDLITYNQELDINFSTYAHWEDTSLDKKYCGKVYNLLAFDTDYANQPIGQNAQLSTGYGAFQNDYNGNYHKIIDYCVKSSNQYVGLFGEIYKDGGATKAQISNVVMMVSEANKGNQGNYLTAGEREQNNAGLIISNYQEYVGNSDIDDEDRQRTGIGALVGSDYTVGVTDGEAKVFTIYNCASAGYQVQYHIEPEKSGYKQPLGIALGGMIGYSRGNVAQSTATNDVKLVAKASIEGNNAAVMIGGFTGSAFFGTTLNCYSGGSISVDDSNGTCYVNRLRIGGFCPGWMYAKGVENESNDEDVRYQNIYSYTTISDDVWTVREESGGNYFNHLIPTVSRMRLYYERRWNWSSFKYETKWHTDSENGSNAVRVPGFSYYLTTVFNDNVMDRISGEAEDYFMKDGNDSPKTCDPATYEKLSDASWVNSNTDFGGTVKFISTPEYSQLVYGGYVVPISSELDDEEYTFPLFVFDADGQYVHYGDWPLQP